MVLPWLSWDRPASDTWLLWWSRVLVGTFPFSPCAGSKATAAGALCSELGWIQLGFGTQSGTLSLGTVLQFTLPRLHFHVCLVVDFPLAERG